MVDLKEIENNILKYVDEETEMLDMNMENNVKTMKNKDEKIEERLDKVEETEGTEDKKKDWVIKLLNVIVVVLAIAIIVSLCGIVRMHQNFKAERAQYIIEEEQRQKAEAEKQKEEPIMYYETSVTDKNGRVITLAYPKEFSLVDMGESSGSKRVFMSKSEDLMEITLEYEKDMKSLRLKHIKELEGKGIYIYDLSDIQTHGTLGYYTEKEPYSDIYTYYIGCNIGNDTLVAISIKQSSTLVTHEYVMEYMENLESMFDY